MGISRQFLYFLFCRLYVLFVCVCVCVRFVLKYNISIYLRRVVELCCELYTLMASPWFVGGGVFISKHLVGVEWAHIWLGLFSGEELNYDYSVFQPTAQSLHQLSYHVSHFVNSIGCYYF